MKSMTKSQLADCAGISVKTLMRWCKPYSQELQQMGLRRDSRVLSPAAVMFIAKKFCIDIKT